MISDIQIVDFVDSQGAVYREDVLYTRKNKDGTYDKVQRLWAVGGPFNFIGPQANQTLVRTPNSELLNMTAPNGLKAYVTACEKGPVSFFQPWTQWKYSPYQPGSFSGKIIKTERISPPLEEQVKTLTKQIQELTSQISKLVLANAQLSSTNTTKEEEVKRLSQDLAHLTKLLEKLN